MTPEKLREIWPERDLIVVPLDQVNRFSFQSKTKDFLTISGVPDGFEEISFDELKDKLRTINEVWDLKDSFLIGTLLLVQTGQVIQLRSIWKMMTALSI